MKAFNEIHLEGIADGCNIQRVGKGAEMAALVVRTMHPLPGVPATAKASERFTMFYHRVLVPVTDANRALLESFSGEAGLRSPEPRPVAVDGSLSFGVDGDAVVRCSAEGLSPVAKVSTERNNLVRLSGRVAGVSRPGGMCRLTVETEAGTVEVHVTRSVNPSGWRMVDEGSLSKGDTVVLTGPLERRMFGDGRSEQMVHCNVSARTLTQLKLGKDVRRQTGPSI